MQETVPLQVIRIKKTFLFITLYQVTTPLLGQQKQHQIQMLLEKAAILNNHLMSETERQLHKQKILLLQREHLLLQRRDNAPKRKQMSSSPRPPMDGLLEVDEEQPLQAR